MTSITAAPHFGKKLGSGRFASVYECTLTVDNEPPKSVAIKVYRAGEDSRELFEDEVRIMQAMAATAQTLADKHGGADEVVDGDAHDNADAPMHEYVALCTSAWDRAGADGFFDGTKIQYCLTFPLEPNDLRTVIDLFLKRDSASLPFGLATLIWRDLLRGLDFLRACNIVHGDIKPENILITWSAEDLYKLQDLSALADAPIARIADFGCARVCTGRRNAHTVGTDEYLAPEQILYLGYDTRADMWAAGCVLVELVTGDALYETDPRWMIYYGDDVAALAEELMCSVGGSSSDDSSDGSSESGSTSGSKSDDSILHNNEDHAPALVRADVSISDSGSGSSGSSTDLEWESLFLQLVLITKILGPAPADVWLDAQHYYDRRGQLWGTPVEPADLASILNVNYDIEPVDLRTVVTLATACMHWLPADRATPRDALDLLKKLTNL